MSDIKSYNQFERALPQGDAMEIHMRLGRVIAAEAYVDQALPDIEVDDAIA